MMWACTCLDAEDHFTSGCARRKEEYYRNNPPPPAPPPQPEPRYRHVVSCGCIDAEDHYIFKRCR